MSAPKIISIIVLLMRDQQNYRFELSSNIHRPLLLLSKIDNEHAKIKLLANSYRQPSFKEEGLLLNDSCLSRNDGPSQSRSFKRDNGHNNRNRTKHRSLLAHPSNNKIIGDQLLHRKGTNHNLLRHNQQISKFYERLNPNPKKIDCCDRCDQYNPEKSRVALGSQQTNIHGQDRKVNIFRVKNKPQSSLQKTDISSIPRQAKHIHFGQPEPFEIDSIDIKALSAHLSTLQFLTPSSAPNQIFTFFQSIYEALRIGKLLQPLIKRYNNCIYYGRKVADNNTLHQGMIWYFKDVLYFGEILEGKKHGKGIEVSFQDGQPCAWKGKFMRGHKNGYFEVQTPEYRYNGNLRDGMFDGEGHLTTALSEYRGMFCEGLKEGPGWEKFTNKSQYKGEYFNNKYDGHGEMKAPNYYYKGLFKHGRPDGNGFERTSQFQYLGDFVMGKKEGKGKLKTADGTQIECLFRNGLVVETAQSPRQLVLEHYLSKELHALDEESEQGTLQNMLNEINNSDS